MPSTLVGRVIAVLCFAHFGNCVVVAQESAAKSDRALLKTYCRAISLSVSPRNIQTNRGSIRFRLLVTETEIYKSVVAECIEFTGTDGSVVRVRYSVRLEAEKFVGGSQPGYEGIDVTVGRWENSKQALCQVGSDLYKITFDYDPKKIAVKLANAAQ